MVMAINFIHHDCNYISQEQCLAYLEALVWTFGDLQEAA